MLERRLSAALLCCCASALLATAASAFPIAEEGTEGLSVLVGGTEPIVATYQGNSASFSNDLYLSLDASGNPEDDGNSDNDLFIFNNHASAVGSMVTIGTFAIGTELIFRLHVNNTGNNFFTGAASRNPDNHTHARVQENWLPNETLVSFEDLLNGPFVYNDLSFSFTNTVTTPPGPGPGPGPGTVPEPGTLLLTATALVALLGRKRLSRR